MQPLPSSESSKIGSQHTTHSCNEILRTIHTWREFCAAANALESTKQKGDLFEHLVQLFLQHQPEYQVQLESVWLFEEVPAALKHQLNLSDRDRGIDLLARTRDGEFWGIQAKYRSDDSGYLPLKDLGSFGTQVAAVTKGLSRGVICATKREKTPDFAAATFKFQQILLDTWESLSAEFWETVREATSGQPIHRLSPIEPRDYQKAAVNAAYTYFIENQNRRGKLIMPCGTGKSLMAFWTAVKALKAKTVVVAVPSLDLIRQTLTVWARESVAAGTSLDVLIVCSDESVSAGDTHVDDLAAPVTTKPEEIESWLHAPKHTADLRVVFATYQSGIVFADAASVFQFDVGLFDEAHKTAGFEGKRNQHLLHDENLSIRHRVFLTATERYYDGESNEVVGMNDASIYGERYYYMPFAEAIDRGILADYSVVLLAVTTSEAERYRDLIKQRFFVRAQVGLCEIEAEELEGLPDRMTADDLATAVALRKAVSEFKLRHAISFHAQNRLARDFVAIQQALNGTEISADLATFRVSSELSSGRRHQQLRGFAESERALISNARCLTEGVDVPGIDLVLFAQPRQSKVDIVQAVGRALRKPENQPDKRGYVLVPVLVEDDQLDLEQVAEGSGFENLVSMLKAMATVDDDITDRITVVLGEDARRRSEKRGLDSDGSEVLRQSVVLEQFSDALRLRAWDRLEGLRKPRLTEEQILEWADAHKAKTEEWPNQYSGFVPNSSERWDYINTALIQGRRGLIGGSSLANLLHRTRGVRHHLKLPPLTDTEILSWADAFFQHNGLWPTRDSGKIPETAYDTWSTVNSSLIRGMRALPGGSSLARLLHEKRGVRNHMGLPALSKDRILEWADSYFHRIESWPTRESGPIPESPGDTWSGIQRALSLGGRNLPGGSSLAQLLEENRGVRNLGNLSLLTEARILEWADAHLKRTGSWPTRKSGDVQEAPGEEWSRLNSALTNGRRGLPGRSSLTILLERERGVRHPSKPPLLTPALILEWAEAHFVRTGSWPHVKSGAIPECPGDTWHSVQSALVAGRRGLPGGSSLAQFLEEQGKVRNPVNTPKLEESTILQWADAYHQHKGGWPNLSSGEICGVPGEKWANINAALAQGTRGLPGGSSLAQLLEERRGFSLARRPPPLTEAQILQWADDHYLRTGKWPGTRSGEIPNTSGESWIRMHDALYVGKRGLPGGSSLAKLLEKERGVRNSRTPPPLSVEQILTWARHFHDLHGEWPSRNSGVIAESPVETWSAIDTALKAGLRGLPGNSSLAILREQSY